MLFLRGSVLAAASALSLVVLVALVPFAGCSTDQGLVPDGGSYGTLPDTGSQGGDGAPQDAAPTCKPADVSTFKADPYHAARPQPNSCTLDQINRFYAACLAPGSSTCGIFIASDASASDQLCAACIISRPSDPTYGPIIQHPGWQELNVAGCVELTDPTGLSCSKSYQAAQECEDEACKDNCAVMTNDPASFGAYQSCTSLAASIGCENFSGPAMCITAATGSADGNTTICGTGDTFQHEFTSFALLFCGPRDGGVPLGDGGQTDATSGDATGD
jgi:hypothetical protein